MSSVTNIVLVYGLCNEEFTLLEEINSKCDSGSLVHVEDERLPSCWFCNGKTLEANIAIGAFNNLCVNEWIAELQTIDFQFYECDYVQMLVQDQESNGFGLITIWSDEHFQPWREL